MGYIRVGDGSLGYSLFSGVHKYDFIGIWSVISSRDFHTRYLADVFFLHGISMVQQVW